MTFWRLSTEKTSAFEKFSQFTLGFRISFSFEFPLRPLRAVAFYFLILYLSDNSRQAGANNSVDYFSGHLMLHEF